MEYQLMKLEYKNVKDNYNNMILIQEWGPHYVFFPLLYIDIYFYFAKQGVYIDI
jgi:hypothetical protein